MVLYIGWFLVYTIVIHYVSRSGDQRRIGHCSSGVSILHVLLGTSYQSHDDQGLAAMAMKLWTSFCNGIDWLRMLRELGAFFWFHPSRPPDQHCGPPKAWCVPPAVRDDSLHWRHFPSLNCCFMGWLYDIPVHPRYGASKSYSKYSNHC